jgi:hypothetical protein
MDATYDVNLRDGFAVVFLYDVQHLLLGQLPAFVAVGIDPGIGAEIAGEDTDVGGLDMEIAIEIGLVAVFAFADIIGEGAQEGKAAFFEQQDAFCGCDPLLREDLFADGF